ncbi:hypothetical protein BKA61DRAFT_721523 [Leptodontidium sp. MPI-SDFR-AT-0119]|nr:hypothetical protein BKA61DRAFT_721523 [Leptodontidium sp. MPI-SDFR-AT-0119]
MTPMAKEQDDSYPFTSMSPVNLPYSNFDDWQDTDFNSTVRLSTSTSSGSLIPVAAPPASSEPITNTRTQCNFLGCVRTFKRPSDRKRHEDSVHLNVPGTYLCHVPGCPKSQGKGYKRADKVTEHLWKKHANLGYIKA